MQDCKEFEPNPPSEADLSRFSRALNSAMANGKVQNGIGTLAEKDMHAVLKSFVCPDTACHEIKLQGRKFVADICIGKEIFEVQTRSFAPMKKKIAWILENTDYRVTIVHPIIVENKVTWLSKSGELEETVKGHLHEKVGELPYELYSMREFLTSKRFAVRLLFIKTHDFRHYRLSKKSRRIRQPLSYRIPTEYLGDMLFEGVEDYQKFLPNNLQSPFRVSDYAKKMPSIGLNPYSAVYLLEALGLIQQVENIGRAKAYKICEET